MTEELAILNGTGEPERVSRPDPRIFCFEAPEHERAFERTTVELMGHLVERERGALVSARNMLRMNHGRNWVHSARETELNASMHSISTEWLLPFKDIADNDLNLIARSIVPVSEDMSRQFAQTMYGVVSAAAERVGNVVDAKVAGSVSASLIEMMSKIELGVDRDGKVSMPQIHVGPEAHAKLVEGLKTMSPEDAAELERLRLEKSQQALDREQQRRARFRKAAE